MKIVTAVALLLGVMVLPLHAAENKASTEAKVPVATARQGFTPAMAKELRDRYTYKDVISAGDVSLYHFLNVGQWMQTATISRQGNVVDLSSVITRYNLAVTGEPNADGKRESQFEVIRSAKRISYTPNWKKAARKRIVSEAYIKQIQTGGRKEIFLKGELGNRLTAASFPVSPPSSNHWQWDAVWADGDFYKGGVYGQGLYVSPAKDLVIVWFSTVMSSDLTQYARQIAMNTPALR